MESVQMPGQDERQPLPGQQLIEALEDAHKVPDIGGGEARWKVFQCDLHRTRITIQPQEEAILHVESIH
jgi:hypothetical protein